MKREYEDYFERRYRLYVRGFPRLRYDPFLPFDSIDDELWYSSRALRYRLGTEIDEQTFRRELRWRADAKLYIATNIYENVLAPISYIVPSSIIEFDIWNDVNSDIEKLVLVSEEISSERERKYVSGTSVLKATSRLIDKLRSTRMEIWGESDETRGEAS